MNNSNKICGCVLGTKATLPDVTFLKGRMASTGFFSVAFRSAALDGRKKEQVVQVVTGSVVVHG